MSIQEHQEGTGGPPHSLVDGISRLRSHFDAERLLKISENPLGHRGEEAELVKALDTIAFYTYVTVGNPDMQADVLMNGYRLRGNTNTKPFFSESPKGELRFSHLFRKSEATGMTADTTARTVLEMVKRMTKAPQGSLRYKPVITSSVLTEQGNVVTTYEQPVAENVSLAVIITGRKDINLMGLVHAKSLYADGVSYGFALKIRDPDGSLRKRYEDRQKNAIESPDLTRIKVFIGPTEKEPGFREPVVHQTAVAGYMLRREQYTTFVALYPKEGKKNETNRHYFVQYQTAGEQTLKSHPFTDKVINLEIPKHRQTDPEMEQAYTDPALQARFELAAARLNQPSVVVAFGEGEDGTECIGLFCVLGMTPEQGLALLQNHIRPNYSSGDHQSEPVLHGEQ